MMAARELLVADREVFKIAGGFGEGVPGFLQIGVAIGEEGEGSRIEVVGREAAVGAALDAHFFPEEGGVQILFRDEEGAGGAGAGCRQRIGRADEVHLGGSGEQLHCGSMGFAGVLGLPCFGRSFRAPRQGFDEAFHRGAQGVEVFPVERDVHDSPGNVHDSRPGCFEVGENARPVGVDARGESAEEEELLEPVDPLGHPIGPVEPGEEPEIDEPVPGGDERGFRLGFLLQDDLPESFLVVEAGVGKDGIQETEKLVGFPDEGFAPDDEGCRCGSASPLRDEEVRGADAAGMFAHLLAHGDVVHLAGTRLEEGAPEEADVGEKFLAEPVQGKGEIEVNDRAGRQIVEEQGRRAERTFLAGDPERFLRQVAERERWDGGEGFRAVGSLLKRLEALGGRGDGSKFIG